MYQRDRNIASAASSSQGSQRTNRINVLIFSGPGVSQSCLLHLKTTLSTLLKPRYDVLSISAESLIKDPWTDKCALLAFPGGRDVGYLSSLGEVGCKRISDWVRNEGGRYLGLCAGAYFASDRIEFERGRQGFEVIGERPLKFFPAACKGTAFPGFVYDSEDGARDAVIALESKNWMQYWPKGPWQVDVYYNGGGFFEVTDDSRVTVVARYHELVDHPAAGVLCSVGEGGKAFLWAVHPEHPSVMPATPKLDAEDTRTALMRATLKMLDLEVPEKTQAAIHPTPLLLASLDTDATATLASEIQTRYADASNEWKDLQNTFVVYNQDRTDSVFSQHRHSDHNKLHLIVCAQSLPSLSVTPIFHFESFAASLRTAREDLRFPYKPSFGTDIMYGEVVTSTQSVLEKNPRLLSALPSGFVFVGSHQIAGRGRGSNNWLSPPGCLQFSLVLRAPRELGPQLVFVQYLFGLSVVEAVRSIPGYGELGLRLKWPNDLYADFGEAGGLKKIGGILVSSSFAGGDFTVIIGCGINTTNSGPTTSLLDIISTYSSYSGHNLPVISQEQLLGRILPRFEFFWTRFEQERSFSSFAELYNRRWLHTDKEVVIQETGQKVRIVGLAPENGYLRTVTVTQETGKPEIVDLQPDGNSFDMMQGLLKAKK